MVESALLISGLKLLIIWIPGLSFEANVIGTPGSGFGPSGEGYLRLTAFNTLENTKEAMDRISKLDF